MQNLHCSSKFQKFSARILMGAAVVLLAACGDGVVDGTTTTVSTGPTAQVATIQISGIPTTVKSDGTTTALITVTAVSATNSTVSGATITLVTDTGLLSAQTLTTDSVGQATATFSSGAADKSNRTATVTATAGTATALLPIQIVGSTVALTVTGSTSLSTGGASPATLNVFAKDAGNNPIAGATVTLTQTGSGTVTLTPTTGTTDSTGKLVVSVAGATAGTATVTAAAVGATATQDFTVSAAAATFGITHVTLNAGTPVVPTSPKTTSMRIGDSLVVEVTAPGVTSVIFATSIGTWTGAVSPPSVLAVTPNGSGIATATLTTTSAGVANVQVYDAANASTSDTMTIGMTASAPARISLQASPTVVSKSLGSTVGYSNLNAIVYDASGAPVGGAPVAFSIVAGTGTNSGETVSPVVVFTASTTANGLALGSAPTIFTSGSLSSNASGVQIRASVVGTTIATQPIGVVNTTTSSLDAAIIVGGTAGSVAFGQAAKIIDAGGSSTIYTFPMSVLVADSNGSPAPLGTVVNISVRPVGWTTGSSGVGCTPDPDGFVWSGTAWVAGNGGTFMNEDANENLVLDAGEDSVRKFLTTKTATSSAGYILTASGTSDSQITPLNSYGGTVTSTKLTDAPGTTTTDAYGVATFNLTYTKSSAFWVVSRIRAQAIVQGTPAVGELNWRLVASEADASPTACYLPPSPFTY